MKLFTAINRVFLTLCLTLSGVTLFAQKLSIIPEPVSLQIGQGAFTLSGGSDISVPPSQPEVSKIATYLAARVKAASGFDLKIGSTSRGAIQLELFVRQDVRLG